MNKNLRLLLATFIVAGFALGSIPMAASAAGPRLDLELWWMPVERPYFPDAKSVAEIMQKNLQAVGVKIKLVSMEWGEYLDKTNDGDHDMALLGWSADIADPDNFLYVLLHGNSAVVGTAMNVAFYNNSEVNDLLDEAQSSTNFTLRDKLYKDASWIIHKDAPWVTVAHSENLAGVLSTVTGYKTHPTGQGANVYANVSESGSGALIIARGGDSVTLDPAEWTDGQSWKVGRQIYDGLYNLPANSTDVVPALATGNTVSADGKSWNFTLREGVTFHDGTAFNSSAVVFSFERAKYWDDNTSSYYTNGWVPPEAGYYDYIYGDLNLNVSAIDEFTVNFEISKAFQPFLASTAMGVFAIVSPSYVKNHPGTNTTDRLGLNPVGTGPYKLKDWTADATITLEAFTGYWSAAPLEAEIIFKVIPEAATRIGELTATSPTVHIVDNVAATDAATVTAATGVNLVSQAGMNVGYLAMNRLRAPFNNKTQVADPDFGGTTSHGNLLSRAFNYAIDRDTIIKETYNNRAIKAVNPLPPNFWGYNATIPQYPYNATYAAELIASLGYDSSEYSAGFSPIISIMTTLSGFIVLVVLTKRKKK